MSVLILGMIIGFIKALIELHDSRTVCIKRTNNLFTYIFNTTY